MQILCFGSADFEERNWVNAQHLMWRLAATHEVLYVNSLGLRMPRAGRRDARRVLRRLGALIRPCRQPDPARRLFVLAPLTLPPARGRLWGALRTRLLAAQLRAQLRRHGFERPLAWVFLPSAADVLARLPLGPVVYHCVDAYEANPNVDRALVLRMERELLARAACVIATSAPLHARLAARHGRVLLMPNVVDLDAYPPLEARPPEPPELAGLPHPRVGYCGNLAAYKCDLALLTRAARARPRVTWVFIGGIGQGEAGTPVAELLGLPNVRHLGEQPRERLGAFLHHLDAGLIPFVDNETTRHSFPMKFFEYLACGLPVVSRALPSLREHLRAPHAFAYTSAEGFLDALDRALAPGEPADREARRALAERHAWDARMREIERLLAELSIAPQRVPSISTYSP
jgi:glycosyltransferase involved in cell wall biosynthesis